MFTQHMSRNNTSNKKHDIKSVDICKRQWKKTRGTDKTGHKKDKQKKSIISQTTCPDSIPQNKKSPKNVEETQIFFF